MIEMLSTLVVEFWSVLTEMAPYLLFGMLVAGLLSVLISPETVERHLGGRGIVPIAKASLFGVPLPLCSCGVIPVTASLRRHGASRGAATSFLISTPQTGVDSILVTFSLLGPVYAVFRPVAAFVSGVVGGGIVSLFERYGRSGEDASGGDAPVGEAPQACEDDCCSGDPERGKLYRILHYGFVALPQDIGRALLVGLVIAGLISAAIPDDFFSGILGTGIVAMFVMMLLGIPVYVCATASVPVAAALIAKGVSPGAALVFLMTGPATNAAAITTIWKVMGRRTAVVYLGTVALAALASGLVLDYVFQVSGAVPAAPEMRWMMPGFLRTLAALVLFAVLLPGALRISWGRRGTSPPPESEKSRRAELTITGMTCNHCAQSVRRALGECAGVDSVEVDLAGGKAVVVGGDFDEPSLRRAVESLGFGTGPASGPASVDTID